jgi:imidazolonepropionase-like amidohydrolase
MRLLYSLLFVFGSLIALQAQPPVPAAPQQEPIVITNVTVHLGNGKAIEQGAIAFEEGKITFLGPTQDWPGYDTHRMIDGKNGDVYPGFIAMNTNLGLTEIGAVRATNDYREVGTLTPSVRALIAYNTDSELIPTVRSNGVLLAQIVPQGGRIAGLSSSVSLDAWNWEDAVLRADQGLHLYWPRLFSFNWRERRREKNKNYDEQVKEVRDFMKAAQTYCGGTDAEEKNLNLEAMCPLFAGSRRLYIHTDDAKSIQQAVLLAEEYGLTPVIVGGRDSWLITDFLKRHKVPVVLGGVQELPGRKDADIDQPFKTPQLLHEGGVDFTISNGGSWQERNLAFQAGQAVAFGLNYEEAIEALTLTPAKVLGIDNRVGSLEVGKEATLFLSTGDALDMRTNQLQHAFISGREIDLDNRHKVLYRKYKNRYED